MKEKEKRGQKGKEGTEGVLAAACGCQEVYRTST